MTTGLKELIERLSRESLSHAADAIQETEDRVMDEADRLATWGAKYEGDVTELRASAEALGRVRELLGYLKKYVT
jgi:hypothetical protein